MGCARGELIFTIRDADTFQPDTVERMADHWYAIPAAEREGFVGVSCNTHDENHVLIGTRFPSDVFDSDYCESTYRSHVSGEKWGMQRLDLMREYMLPPPRGYLGWYPESIVWRRMAQRYQTRYINDSLRTYYQNVSGTRTSVGAPPWRDAYGVSIDSREALILDMRWFRYSPVRISYHAFKYAKASLHLGRSLRMQFHWLPTLSARALWLVFLPLASIVYFKENRRRLASNVPRPADYPIPQWQPEAPHQASHSARQRS